MKEKKANLEALTEINNYSLSNQRNIATELNSLLIECTQDLYDQKIQTVEAGLFEKLLIQVIYHNETLINLTYGTLINVRETKKKIHDLTAVYSVTRLQIETFINLTYLYFLDCEYPKELRISLFKIHGLRKQIELTKKYAKDFEPVKKIRKELAEELLKMRKLDIFKNTPFIKRKKFTEPKYARLLNLKEIYNLAKIGDLSKLYSLYSNHIHSEYISIRQHELSVKDSSILENIFPSVMFYCSRMTAILISNLKDQYLKKNNSYKKAPIKQKKIIENLINISINWGKH